MKDNKFIKVYHDTKTQEMVDAVYKASGKMSPSEELMRRAAAGQIEAKLLQSEAQKKRDPEQVKNTPLETLDI